MEYIAVCFEEQCRLGNRQIFCSGNYDSQLHQSHEVELLHPFSSFTRSIKTQPIKFHEGMLKMRAQLQEQYQRSVQRVKSALRVGFQQCERRIRDIYKLNGEEITLKLFEPHLREKTPQTELWLTLINWKKDHPTEDIKKYIQDMPATWIKDYTATTSNLLDSFLSNLPKSSNKLQEENNQPNTQKLQEVVRKGSRVIKKISRQISHIYEHSVRPKEIDQNQQRCKVKEIRSRKEEALRQLAAVFCSSKSQPNYKDFGQSLPTKLRTTHIYKSHLSSIFRRVYNGITGQVSNDLRYRRLRHGLNFIVADLKNYRIWMQSNEADIFNRCVRFFMKLDKSIVINPSEIYTIYVLIIIRMMEKTMKNEKMLPRNSPGQRLLRDMMYLYNHFSNLHTVTQLVTWRYHYAELQQVKQVLKEAWRKIVVDTYALLKEKESIQNVEFFQLVFQQQDFCRQQFWGSIMGQYIKYRLHGIMDNSEREGLEQCMMIVVRNGRTLQRFANKEAENLQGTDAEDEIESLESFAVSIQDTVIEERTLSMQCSSKAKREQLSTLELNNDEMKQQGQQAQSILRD